MVRLLHQLVNKWDGLRCGFNPTMVRLLLSLGDAVAGRYGEFQSHNGAIAAKVSSPNLPSFMWFQSHNGAIAAQSSGFGLVVSLSCFNPTMVRLLRVLVAKAGARVFRFNPTMVRLLPALLSDDDDDDEFQSHNGAIAACIR